MKQRKFLSLFLIILILTLLISLSLSAAAVYWVCDINGDGKITAFDAQMIAEYKAGIRTLDETQQAAADNSTVLHVMDFILGRTQADLGDLNGDRVFEIYSAEGLFEIAENPKQDYILMADIDLAGVPWTPVVGFDGSFDGNGHTISNLSITTSTPSCYDTKGAAFNMGFFGDPTTTAVITDLHLQNVTLTASEDAQYIGLLAGTNRGQITGCTATGTIIDTRPAHGTTDDTKTWIGALAGRILKVSDGQPTGSVIGGATLSVTDGANVATTSGLSADVTFQITDRQGINLAKGTSQPIGLVGWYPSGATVSGIYRDNSNSSTLLSEDIQARQEKMIDHMHAMGTVQWTPSETLVFKAQNGSQKTYYAGTTYTGMPYTHNYGSLARFQSALNEDGTTKTGLGDTIWTKEEGYTGFATIMGNNCVGAVYWAWLQASPVIVHLPSNQTNPYHGGVYARYTFTMIPTEENRVTYGIYPVGNWSDFSMIDPETGKNTDVPYDASKAAYQCTDETYSGDVRKTNGTNTILEAYAQSRRADALIVYSKKWYGKENAGHVQLIVADPVVIRNANGSIDVNKSYMVTSDQGAEDVEETTWRIKWAHSFRELVDDPEDPKYSGEARTFLPITIRALHDTNLRQSYVTAYSGEEAVTGPTSGRLYSNYRLVSTTVTVKNGNAVIYQGEAFTGMDGAVLGQFNTTYLHGHVDGFAAAAQAANLKSGIYTFSVHATTSDGITHDVITNQIFTYTAP